MKFSNAVRCAAACATLMLLTACTEAVIDPAGRRVERLVKMRAYANSWELCPQNGDVWKRSLQDDLMLSAVFDRLTSTLTWSGGVRPMHAPMTGGEIFVKAFDSKSKCRPGEVIRQFGPGQVVEGQAVLTPTQADKLLNGRLQVQINTADYPRGVAGGPFELLSNVPKLHYKNGPIWGPILNWGRRP